MNLTLNMLLRSCPGSDFSRPNSKYSRFCHGLAREKEHS
jgi:hypothetical protein